jgi:hypothetical protein
MSTFVLVHGSWQGGWAWDEVRRGLEERGHRALAPTLPGHHHPGEDRTRIGHDDLVGAVLATLLPGAWVRLAALRRAGRTPVPYTAQPDGDALAVAATAGISALSPTRQVVVDAIGRLAPDLHAHLTTHGGRHLELGCGVGNVLLSLLVAYPRLTAVGVELDPVTLAETRRRAQLLGVADRVELRRMDAADPTDQAAFDHVRWSQFFFPAPGTRPIAPPR